MSSNKDPLGTRMKTQYEFRARQFLPRRTYTILRLDGKAFHTYTRGLDKPFDQAFMNDMAYTAQRLCEQVQGAVMAYTQSDEISLLMTDFATNQTEAWFDGNVQKIVSVAASIATAEFGRLRQDADDKRSLAFTPMPLFDCRIFTIPDRVEVENYFIWRQQDATRNSISMAAQASFSHKSLMGLSANQMQEKLFTEAGINWNDYPWSFRRGTLVWREEERSIVSFVDGRTQQENQIEVDRKVWKTGGAPMFTVVDTLDKMIPKMAD